MNNFNWGNGLGFGLILAVVMLVVSFVLGWFGVGGTLAAIILTALLAAVVAYLFMAVVGPQSLGQAAGYGLLWAVITFVLDFAFLHNFDTSVLYSWQYWMLFAGVLVGSIVHGFVVDTQREVPGLGAYQ